MKRFQQLVKERLYPVLESSTTSIEDAKMVLQVAMMTIRQALLIEQKKITVSALDIPKLSGSDERLTKVIDVFITESPSDAMEVLEGMSTMIDGCIREQNMKSTLKDIGVESRLL